MNFLWNFAEAHVYCFNQFLMIHQIMCGSTDFFVSTANLFRNESSLSSVLTLILTEIKLVFVRSKIYANICIATLGTEALSAIAANLKQPGQLVFNCDGYKV